jgi:hypothetical protein
MQVCTKIRNIPVNSQYKYSDQQQLDQFCAEVSTKDA